MPDFWLPWQSRGRGVSKVLRNFFAPVPLESLTINERRFPDRIRPDLQRALDILFTGNRAISHFSGVRGNFHETVTLQAAISPNVTGQHIIVPAVYEELDIGEESPARCLNNGLWLGEEQGVKFAVTMARAERPFGEGVRIQIGTAGGGGGDAQSLTERLFGQMEKSIREATSYRGKVLSLESRAAMHGQESTIQVHKLRAVKAEDVILPAATLALLQRNVLGFVARREKLGAFGQARKKGLLFYGPPGTGKTHTLHYLAGALQGHSTLLISAEQVGQLSDYMTLARLLQPSMIVIEDADLIGRERTSMHNICEESILNKLLNEMDGLREDADILFVLTTNRPETLEPALTARPGRIDQAIEFPLPDDAGRAELVRLYSRGVAMDEPLVAEVVKRTAGVSGAFIKELMRRAVQFHLEKSADQRIDPADVHEALEEMLFRGGSLNLKLLGGAGIINGQTPHA